MIFSLKSWCFCLCSILILINIVFLISRSHFLHRIHWNCGTTQDSTQAENLNQRQTSAENKHYALQIRFSHQRLAMNEMNTGQLDRVDCNITQRVHQKFQLDTKFGIKKLFETYLITSIEYSKSKQTVLFLAKIDLSAFLQSNHSFRSIHPLAQKARTRIGRFFSLNCDVLFWKNSAWMRLLMSDLNSNKFSFL